MIFFYTTLRLVSSKKIVIEFRQFIVDTSTKYKKKRLKYVKWKYYIQVYDEIDIIIFL
jgi:hypothetical protein